MARRLLHNSAGWESHSDGILAEEWQVPGEYLFPLTIPHVVSNLLSLQEPGPPGEPKVDWRGPAGRQVFFVCVSLQPGSHLPSAIPSQGCHAHLSQRFGWITNDHLY